MDGIFDVCIIGSGVAGGLLAAELAATGKRIAVVEAGKPHDRAEMQRRIAEGAIESYSINPRHLHVPVSVNAVNCSWGFNQAKRVGGNSLFWEALAIRPYPVEFRMKSEYGVGMDWPLSYEDLEPYFCRAEEELGVSGSSDNPHQPPRSRPYPLPEFPISYVGKKFAHACDRLGYFPQPLPYARTSRAYRDRAKCCIAARCSTCPTTAKYSSDFTHLRAALESSNVELLTESFASKLSLGEDGRAQALLCHRPDRSTFTVRAGLFVVACNGIESARLLLQSAQDQHPEGLANVSGAVGRNFMSHADIGVAAVVSEPVGAERNFSSVVSRHFEVGAHRRRHSGFRIMEGWGASPVSLGHELVGQGFFGKQLVSRLREQTLASFYFDISTEVLPDWNNRVELDLNNRDFFGNPGLKMTIRLSDYERGCWQAVQAKVQAIAEGMGAAIVTSDPSWEKPSWRIMAHQIGTTRMGKDRNHSVVNTDLRAHDVPNLYLAGASVFPNALGPCNPTLTLSALTLRLAEHLRTQVLT